MSRRSSGTPGRRPKRSRDRLAVQKAPFPAGALIAVGFAWILRGPGGDPGGLAAARGMLSPADLDAAHTSPDSELRPPN